jgi:hypothetical protein
MDFQFLEYWHVSNNLTNKEKFCITYVPSINMFTLRYLYAFQSMGPCSNLGIYNPIVLRCTKFILVDFLAY